MKKIPYAEELSGLITLLNNKYGIDASALDCVNETMREAKKELDAVLGLNESNNYRMQIDVPLTEDKFRGSYPKLVSSVCAYFQSKFELINVNTDIIFTSNSLRNGKNVLKISKLIAKDIEEIWASVLEPHLATMQKALSFKVTKQNFVTAFSMLTKCGTVFVSTNPTDFILSSNDSWGNCMRVAGGHFNGNMSYMNDKFTVIIFVERSADVSPIPQDGGKYAGRIWSYIFPKEGTIISAHPYSDIPEQHRRAARAYIERCIAEKYGYAHKWRVARRSTYPEFDKSKASWGGDSSASGPIYFDGAKGVTLAMNRDTLLNQFMSDLSGDDDGVTEVEASDTNIKYPFLKFGSSLCLKCGREHTNREHAGRCTSNCSGRKVCDICGKAHYVTSSERIPHGYKYVCPACIFSKFITCSCCNELVNKDKTTIHDTSSDKSTPYKLICDSCYTKLYKTCTGCGKNTGDETLTVVDSDRLCSKCMQVFSKNNLIYDCTCGSKHIIDTLCSKGGVSKVAIPVAGRNIRELLERQDVKDAIASKSLSSIINLDPKAMEAYFVSVLMNDILSPGFAQQMAAMTSGGKKAVINDAASEE